MFEQKYEYDTKGRSVRGQFERIAKTAADHLRGTKLDTYADQAEKEFFNLLWSGLLSPSTPVLANMGTDRGMSVSCSGGYIEDSVGGFYETLHETALLTKYGFGTSAYLGHIRPRGSPISVGGKASGVLPVFKDYVNAMRNIAQGTARRGAWAGYIEITHGDFDELVDHIMAEPDDANVGWIVTDEFIRGLEANNLEYIRRFQKVMKMKMILGKGYFCFIDKINRHRPAAYVNHNLYVRASNLCVAPETVVLTDNGHVRIDELEGQAVNVWNGKEFSTTEVKKTGTNQKLLTVKTNSGHTLTCTPYHKFYVLKDYHSGYIVKEAQELQAGDKLIKFDLPLIEGSETLPFAYDNGIFSAEGFTTKDKKFIYLYHEKKQLEPLIASVKVWKEHANSNRLMGTASGLQDKFFVPDSTYTIESRLQWLAGLCDGDGTVANSEGNQSIQISSVEESFLKDVQLMLQTLGVTSKVAMSREAGMFALPANDGTGENKLFPCKTAYRLLISSSSLFKLKQLGFKPHRLEFEGKLPQRNAEQFIRVASVTDEGRIDDTYCFTEPKRHMGMFNGLLTGNCDEITLVSDENHTYTCVLSSSNVSKYREMKDTDAVFWSTVFLDCVAEDFIQKAKGIKGLEKAVRFTQKGRALGLGQCGFHTLLQSEGIPFESFEAHMLSQEIAAHIWNESERASRWLAEWLGEPEWCQGTGLRNSHRIAIAPTKSTALLMGGISEGINPDPAMAYNQTTAAGEVDRINPVLLDLMKKNGVYSPKHIKEIQDAQGSVQHVNWLSDTEKEVFKTAFEINQKAILRMASARGKYIDQWQSLNLFFAADEEPAWIAEVHREAFLDEGIRGLYYVYTQAGVQASKGECEACQ